MDLETHSQPTHLNVSGREVEVQQSEEVRQVQPLKVKEKKREYGKLQLS